MHFMISKRIAAIDLRVKENGAINTAFYFRKAYFKKCYANVRSVFAFLFKI